VQTKSEVSARDLEDFMRKSVDLWWKRAKVTAGKGNVVSWFPRQSWLLYNLFLCFHVQ